MPIRPRHLAEQDFGPFFDALHTSVVDGHAAYARDYSAHASKHRPNTRRSIIRDRIVDRLRAALDGRKGVHIRDRYGTTFFNFFGRWRLTVRMLNEKKLNVVLNRTQLALQFQHNDDVPPLGPLFQGTTAVYLGYLVPESVGDLDVIMVAPDGKRNAWDMPIMPQQRGDVVPLPPRGPTPVPEDEQLVHVPGQETKRESDE